jgi:hypothetical protein
MVLVSLVIIGRKELAGSTHLPKSSICFLLESLKLSTLLPSVAVFNTWHTPAQHLANSTYASSSIIPF